MKKIVLFTVVLSFLSLPIFAKVKDKSKSNDPFSPKHKIVLETNLGKITLEVYPKVAPKTVENFVGLVNKGYYNGVIFHRVIPDFMIQGGDPTGTGRGGESLFGKNFEDEISAKALGLDKKMLESPKMTLEEYYKSEGYSFKNELPSMHCVYGTIAMANAGPNTNGSQFFIVVKDKCEWLDGKHTVFGKVIEGMDVAVKISKVPRNNMDKPLQDVIIQKAYEVK